MPRLTVEVAIGSVLTLTAPGGTPIPIDFVRVEPGNRSVQLDVPTRVWALGDPTTDTNTALVAWIVPAGVFEVTILTPARTIERRTFTVDDEPAELVTRLDQLRAERARIDAEITALTDRLNHR